MQDRPTTIFWSWQSDVSPNTCRHFIKRALVEAVSKVGDQLGLADADRPEVDHDTKGKPGMVDIANTILDKIAQAAVFVADLTPAAKTPKGKALPNPNVLIELGWAFHKPGLSRVIGVLNVAQGCRPDDLPFDIRNRRILPYNLSEDADASTRAAVHKELVSDLAKALRTDLELSLEEVAFTTEVKSVPARESEPSIWASAQQTITHQAALGLPGTQTVRLVSGARGYIRVIPAGWKTTPPTINDIATISHEVAVWPPSGGQTGDFGGSPEGFVRYWITDHAEDGQACTANIAVYFDETGEFWILHGTAIVSVHGQTLLCTRPLLTGWSNAMRACFRIFDDFQASPIRKVELGLTGLEGVQCSTGLSWDSRSARKEGFVWPRTSRDWGANAQLAFLTTAYNRTLDIFGLPKVDASEVSNVLSSRL